MKTYIIGTGGVGGYFGGKLAEAGADVTFLARGEHYEAIRKNGLTVKSIDGDFTVKNAKVVDKISKIHDPELVIFAVKTYDTGEVASQLNEVVNENTIGVTFQNGVYNDTEIKKSLKTANIYPGLAYVISTKVEPGVINQTGGLKKLIFGDRENPENSKLKQVEKLFKDAGIDAVISDDI